MSSEKGISAKDFEKLITSFEGTTSRPHFDRTAFRVRRIFATLAGDGQSANLLLTRDEQQVRCAVQPEVFQKIPNAWGEQGWTTVNLLEADRETLSSILEVAWRIGSSKTPPKT